MTTKRLTLADAVDSLLMHHEPPNPLPVTVVTNPDGSYGVALILDGWYTGEDGAREVLPLWRRDLARVLRALAREQGTS